MDTGQDALFDDAHEHFAALTKTLWGPISQATVDVVGPVEGEQVFDACCGAGASALPTAALVGARGRVDAVDLSEHMLAIGRAQADRLPPLTFHQGDVTTWQGSGYDIVQCVLGIFFLPDMVAGTRALAGRLRAGGRLAITVWRGGAIAPLQHILVAAMGPERPAIRTPTTVVNTPASLADLLAQADLRDIRVEEVPLSASIDADLAWALVLGSGMRAYLAGLDAEVVERTRLRFHETFDIEALDISVLVGIGYA